MAWIQHPQCKILYRSDDPGDEYLGRFGEVGTIEWGFSRLVHRYQDENGRNHELVIPYRYVTDVSVKPGQPSEVGGLWVHAEGMPYQSPHNGVYFSQKDNDAATFVREQILKLAASDKGRPHQPGSTVSPVLDRLAELKRGYDRQEISLAQYAAWMKEALDLS